MPMASAVWVPMCTRRISSAALAAAAAAEEAEAEAADAATAAAAAASPSGLVVAVGADLAVGACCCSRGLDDED